VVLAGLLASGCVVRVVYNQLDWLALWYVEDYFELDPSQEKQAREMVNRTLRWHRQTQLPRYVDFTQTLLGAVGAPVQPAFIAERYAVAVGLYDDLIRQAVPDLAVLLQSMSDAQVEELFASLAERNEELAEDFSGFDAAERRAKQDKAIIKAFRRFTGRLSPAQEVLVRTRTSRFHDLSDDWLRRREAWQGEFRALLEARATEPAFEARLGALLLQPDQLDSPDYRQRAGDNRQAAFGLVAAVLDSLDDRQQDHLRGHLKTYADDFAALLRQQPPAPAPSTTT
jgi:hypothetical protein